MADPTVTLLASHSAGDHTAKDDRPMDDGATQQMSGPASQERFITVLGALVPRLETRDQASAYLSTGCFAGALVVALFIAVLAMALSGVPPADLGREIATTVFSGPRAIAAILAQAAPLIIVGLAAAAAFKVGFWNIGIEGQMIMGAMAATAIALGDVGTDTTRLALMALASMVGGIAWISVPAWLKARLGISEVITTLLLNYVAFYALLHMLFGPWTDPASSFPHSAQFDAVERVAEIAWQNLTGTVVIAGCLALLMLWLSSFSRVGYFMSVVGNAPRMARAVGLPVVGLTVGGILLSGSLTGLAGFAIASGVEYRLTRDFFDGYLFAGILIAFLGRNHALGVTIAALFLAMLMQLGQTLQVFYGTPAALVQLIQAIFILCVASSDFFVRYRLHWRLSS